MVGIALVPRGVRALADQLNAYYRVFKGTDPDSIFLRLNSGGAFEVRHSATQAPLLRVTDAGTTVTIGTGNIADGAVTSAKIADDTIVNVDVNSGAAIAVTKLAHLGAGNVLRSDGSQNVAGKIVTGDIADGTIQGADIQDAQIGANKMNGGGTPSRVLKTTDGTTVVWDQVVNADVGASAAIALTKLAPVGANQLVKDVGAGTAIGGGLLVDANVAPAGSANIAVAKLAHVGAGNVLRSNGTANVAGQVINADIAPAGTANIDGAKLAVNSVPSDRLIGGATIPANSIDSSHIVDGSVMNADINAAAAIALSKLAAGSNGQKIETVAGAPAWLTVPSARVYHSADQSIANSTETVLAFNSERFDTASLHDTATNNSRLTAPIAGKYLIGVNVRWESNPTGNRILSIRHGTGIDIAANYMPATVQAVQAVSALWQMAVNDYVQIFVTHFAGVALNIQAAGNISPEFWMVRVSA